MTVSHLALYQLEKVNSNKESLRDEGEQYGLLESVVADVIDGDLETALLGLENLGKWVTEPSSHQVKYIFFMNAIMKRIRKLVNERGNLYLLDFDTRQIDLFTLLAKHVPYISISARSINQYLSQLITSCEDPVLIDIGIGTGRQIVDLLNLLSNLKKPIRQLKIVGIEPSEKALNEAKHRINQVSQTCGIPVEFTPILHSVENLSKNDWAGVKKLGGNFLINGSFALHHVRTHKNQQDMKDAVLEKFWELKPTTFVLSEPYSDHETPDLLERFRNAWKHFGLVFDTIDELNLTLEEELAIKQFFSREIEDIIGSHEEQRSERHETAEMWLDRLRKTGFSPDPKFFLTGNAGFQEGISMSKREGYLGLDFRHETVVALMAVQLANRSLAA